MILRIALDKLRSRRFVRHLALAAQRDRPALLDPPLLSAARRQGRPRREYFDEIQDVKVTKDMLDLAKHIVEKRSGRFEPGKFEDHYESALVDLNNSKRSGKPITAKVRPRGENVVDLMEALRRSVGGAAAEKASKKPRKAAAGQK